MANFDPETELTVERIIRDDWIGQARKLADEKEVLKVQTKAIEAKSQKRYTSFALEFKVDDNNFVKQTRLLHVEGAGEDSEEIWSGWNGERLLDFIVKCGKLQIRSSESDAAKLTKSQAIINLQPEIAQAPDSEGIEPSPSGGDSTYEKNSRINLQDNPAIEQSSQTPILSKFEAFSKLRNRSAFSIKYGEPYSVNISMDLSNLGSFSDDDELEYRAIIKAKNLGEALQIDIGTGRGRLILEKNASVNVDCSLLPPGDYRLSAMVTLNLSNRGYIYDIKSNFNGSLIHIW